MSSDYLKKNPESIEDDNEIDMDLWKDFEEIGELDSAELRERLESGMDEFRNLITKLENAHLSPEDITDEQIEAINRNNRTFIAWCKKNGIEVVEEDSDAK